MVTTEVWKPGSFTKNFGWGKDLNGLIQLYNSIKLGFSDGVEDTPRDLFRSRIEPLNKPDQIPTNFFLFNKNKNGRDEIIADELIFQAISSEHSPHFDKLALFAFNFSYAGKWSGSQIGQRRPALWAFHYAKDYLSNTLHWKIDSISAKDIENFVATDPRYAAKSAHKLSTNLYHLYSKGGLSDFQVKTVDRWWADALFLALDRLIEDRLLDGMETSPKEYEDILSKSDFRAISGRGSLEKNLAEKHLIRLYITCGGRERFSVERTRGRVETEIINENREIPNSDLPFGAVHPTNPNILKSIPPTCVPLARAAGFDIVRAVELESFNSIEYAEQEVNIASEKIKKQNIKPTMTAEELMKLTRE